LIETARCAHARLELRESARGNLPFQHSIHFFRVLQRAASFRVVLSPAIDADKDIALALQRGESRIRRAGGQRPKISRQIRSKGLPPSSENFRLPLTAASKLGANWIPVRAVQKSAAEQRSQCWAKQAQSPFTAIPPTFSPITTSIKSNACITQRIRYSTTIKSGSPAQITRSVYTKPSTSTATQQPSRNTKYVFPINRK